MIVNFFQYFFGDFCLLFGEFQIVEEIYCMVDVYIGNGWQWGVFYKYVVCFVMQMCVVVVGVWMVVDEFCQFFVYCVGFCFFVMVFYVMQYVFEWMVVY